MMAIDFPSSPTDGQGFYPVMGGPLYIYKSAKGAWTKNSGTALRTNMIKNSSLSVSQQNGNTAGTTPQVYYYPADLFTFVALGTAPTPNISFSVSRVAKVTPKGNQYRLSLTLTASPPTTIPSDVFYEIATGVVGQDWDSSAYGTANAKWVVVRFGINTGLAMTYYLTLRNGTTDAVYIVPITVPTANVDTEFIIPIPPCTIGTWLPPTAASLQVTFCPICGSTGIGPINTWTPSGHAGSVTGATLTTHTLELFDFGVYIDPNATGVPPEYQSGLIEDDYQDAQQQYYRLYGARGIVMSATTIAINSSHPVQMLTNNPTQTLVGATLRAYDCSVVPNVTAVTNGPVGSSSWQASVTATAAAGGLTVSRPGGILVDSVETNFIAISGRWW